MAIFRFYSIFIGFTFIFLMLCTSCKSKYEKAYEEYRKRQFHTVTERGDESREEIELLSKAIRYDDDLSNLYYERGEQYRFFKEYDNALIDYKVCLKKEGLWGQLLYRIGLCELGLKKYTTANSTFIQALTLTIKEWEETPEVNKRPNHWVYPEGEYKKRKEAIEKMISYSRERIK